MKKIIKIESLKNGCHLNQIGDFNYIPEGWALIPEGLETPNFPCGEIEVEEVNDIITVTKWTPLEIPKTEYALTTSQLREEIYNNDPIINWEGSSITVSQASQKWMYYFVEGDNEKANELQKLIKKTKQEIREKYPD